MGWRDDAVCRDKDPEMFFPVGTGAPAQLQTAAAKSVCRGCPVVPECLDTAMRGEDWGVWGGMSEQERRAAKRNGTQVAGR